MRKQLLTEWIETGYPYLKESSGLPLWLLPESSLRCTTRELGDENILKMSRPLKLDKGIRNLLNSTSAPAMLSPEEWESSVKNWPNLNKVKPFVGAFMEAVSKIMPHLRNGRLEVKSTAVCRSLAVIGFAPFIPEGESVMEEVSVILGRYSCLPAEPITRYAEAVLNDDIVTIEKVNECIVKHSSWAKWAAELHKQALSLQQTPRLIVVIPPLSEKLVDVLASAVKERQSNESGRDYPRYTGS